MSTMLLGTISPARRLRNRLAVASIWLSVLVAAVPLGFVVIYLVQKGAGIVDWHFLTDDIPISSRLRGPGMGPAVLGTLLITGAATAMAVPLGLLAAVYLNEYGGKGRLASVIRFLSDVMAGVPSIVMGLFIYTVWVLRYGQTGMAGALALGCL
ncbi:MAG: phosphate ABC transporter permease PstA, partial [Actinomycetes bacterium]